MISVNGPKVIPCANKSMLFIGATTKQDRGCKHTIKIFVIFPITYLVNSNKVGKAMKKNDASEKPVKRSRAKQAEKKHVKRLENSKETVKSKQKKVKKPSSIVTKRKKGEPKKGSQTRTRQEIAEDAHVDKVKKGIKKRNFNRFEELKNKTPSKKEQSEKTSEQKHIERMQEARARRSFSRFDYLQKSKAKNSTINSDRFKKAEKSHISRIKGPRGDNPNSRGFRNR